MQRMQIIISEDKPISYLSTEVPFAAAPLAIEQIVNAYTNVQIQYLNNFVGRLDSIKEQQLISEKLYQLFLEKYQALTQLIVSDAHREQALAEFKTQFLTEWHKILKAEGTRNFLMIQYARLETEQETTLKNLFFSKLDQLAAMLDQEELGPQAISITKPK